jgi:hypothetical protein
MLQFSHPPPELRKKGPKRSRFRETMSRDSARATDESKLKEEGNRPIQVRQTFVTFGCSKVVDCSTSTMELGGSKLGYY